VVADAEKSTAHLPEPGAVEIRDQLSLRLHERAESDVLPGALLDAGNEILRRNVLADNDLFSSRIVLPLDQPRRLEDLEFLVPECLSKVIEVPLPGAAPLRRRAVEDDRQSFVQVPAHELAVAQVAAPLNLDDPAARP